MARSNSSLLRISHLPTAAELGFDVTVQRSLRRRTLEVQVREGAVKALVPQWSSQGEVLTFLHLHRDWVLKTLTRQQNTLATYQRHYCDGERCFYLGEAYVLRIEPSSRTKVFVRNEEVVVCLPARYHSDPQAVQSALAKWYQQQARAVLVPKTEAAAGAIGKTVSAIKFRKTKTKWGHCTRDGVIQYNWQIVLAPEAVIDYLVAHEVSHLRHPHHRPSFWRQVAELCPDYQHQRQWLADNALQLSV